jgi:hypothetical protein
VCGDDGGVGWVVEGEESGGSGGGKGEVRSSCGVRLS